MKIDFDFIQNRLTELGIGKSDLADKMGVRPAWVYFLFKGHKSHTFRTVDKLATALSVDWKKLVK